MLGNYIIDIWTGGLNSNFGIGIKFLLPCLKSFVDICLLFWREMLLLYIYTEQPRPGRIFSWTWAQLHKKRKLLCFGFFSPTLPNHSMDLIHKVLNIVLPPITLILLLLFFPYFLVSKFISRIKRSINSEKVAGKVVLITGASSGIGEVGIRSLHRSKCLSYFAD